MNRTFACEYCSELENEGIKDWISLPQQNSSSLYRVTLNPPKWPWLVIFTCELVQDSSPVYVTTNQKADICNGFQVIVCTDTHLYQMYRNMHVFMIIVIISFSLSFSELAWCVALDPVANHCPSLPWCCWLRHVTGYKTVPEMTYIMCRVGR